MSARDHRVDDLGGHGWAAGAFALLRNVDLRNRTPKAIDPPARLELGSRPLFPILEEMRGRSGEAIVTFEARADGAVHIVERNAENE